MSSDRGVTIGLLIAAAILLPACGGSGRGQLPAGLLPSDLSLLVITLDTTRADRIGCYGYGEIATPALDALAARGVLFEQAQATAPLTLPSHSSIFTGSFPPSHGVRDNGGYFLAEQEETLAEILKRNGFSTGGFVSAYVLDRRWGIAQGFDHYLDDFDLLKRNKVSMGDIQRRGEETVDAAISWLRERRAAGDRRLFAWVHLYDPHSPYEPPEPFASAYPGRPYLGEIAYTDSLVGRLLSELDSLGLGDRTVTAVLGDHGESLGEHDESGHAFFIYSVTMRVPFILHAPWPGLSGVRVPHVVSTIDAAPTVLDLLGIAVPERMDGASLVPLAAGMADAAPPGPAYSESFYARYHFGWSDLRTLRTDHWRFIEAPLPELYDVRVDPDERENLASARPLDVEKMRALLSSLERSMAPPFGDALAPVEMDEETQRRLAALGYIGSTVDTTGRAGADLPDPKARIHIVNRMHQAREDSLAGKTDEAIVALRQVVAEAPEVIDAWFRLGNALLEKTRHEEALAMFRKTIELKPDHEWAMVGMADAFVAMGRPDEAILGYEQQLKRDPDNDTIAWRLAETLLDAGRLAESERAFLRVLQMNPSRASAAVGLAAVALGRGDPVAAEREAKRAIGLDPRVRHARHNLALARESRGDAEGAIASYREEIATHPQAVKARFNLARLLGRAGDRAGQIRELNESLRMTPDFAVARFYLAKALLDAGELAAAETEAHRAIKESPENDAAPLGHFVLADIYASTGRQALADEEAQRGRQLQSRDRRPGVGA